MKQKTDSIWGGENCVHPLLFLQFIYSLWASVFSPIEWRLYWLPYICHEDWIIFLESTQPDISDMSPWRHWVIMITAKNSDHNCGTYLCRSLKSHWIFLNMVLSLPKVTSAAPHLQRATLRLPKPTFSPGQRTKSTGRFVSSVYRQGHWPWVGINTLVSKTQAIWGVDHMPPIFFLGLRQSPPPGNHWNFTYYCPRLDSSPSQSHCLLLFCFFLRVFLSKPLFYKSSSEVLLLGNPNLR